MKSLQEILGYVPLCGTIQSTKTGIPSVLPEKLFSTIKPTVGDSGRYTKVDGTRKTARQVMYGSPPVNRELKGVSVQDVKLLHFFEKIQIDVLQMETLRGYNGYEAQERGIDEITRQVQEFKQLFVNTEIAAILYAFSTGKIYYSSEGHLLPSSSGAAVTVDMGINSTTNMGQLQDVAGNTIIGASWNTSSTNIINHIRTIKKTAARRTGYPIKYAFYGENITSYLAKNDYVKDWFTRNPGKNQEYLDTGEIPQGMFGLTWIPAYEAFYEDSASTYQDIWGADVITFAPEIDRSWYEKMEGTYSVPTSFNVVEDGTAAMSQFKRVQGMFAYGMPNRDVPAAFDLNSGHTVLPLIKVPNAVFIADVTP